MKNITELTPRKIFPEFDRWPTTWQGMPEDRRYGSALLKIFELFTESLIRDGLAKSTIRRHMGYLWLLGGELIRDINEDEELRSCPPLQLLKDAVEEDGGPCCRHLESESEMLAFDATCRKLHRFLKNEGHSLCQITPEL